MRMYFAGDRRPKSVAKKLKRAAEANGIEIKLNHAYEVTAKMYGHAGWKDLRASFGYHELSPMDHLVTDDEAEARRAFQSETLANALGIERAIAESLVDTIQPTGRLGNGGQEQAYFEENDLLEVSSRYW